MEPGGIEPPCHKNLLDSPTSVAVFFVALAGKRLLPTPRLVTVSRPPKPSRLGGRYPLSSSGVVAESRAGRSGSSGQTDRGRSPGELEGVSS